MNTEIKDIASLGADEVIVATGSKARKIPVKGADTAIEAVDFLLGNAEVGENVTIIGGGLTGCEIAYDLYLQGKKPTIIEMQDDLVLPSDSDELHHLPHHHVQDAFSSLLFEYYCIHPALSGSLHNSQSPMENQHSFGWLRHIHRRTAFI